MQHKLFTLVATLGLILYFTILFLLVAVAGVAGLPKVLRVAVLGVVATNKLVLVVPAHLSKVLRAVPEPMDKTVAVAVAVLVLSVPIILVIMGVPVARVLSLL